MAIGLGVLTVLLAGFAGEIVLRSTRKNLPFPGFVFTEDLITKESQRPQSPPPEITRWATPRLTTDPPLWFPGPTLRTKQGKYRSFKPGVGYYAHPGSMGISRLSTPEGEKIYEVLYMFDKYGRRRLGGSTDTKKSPALFLGCSFTLGEGVEGHESFPAQFGIHAPQFQPYTMAFHAWGPANLLMLAREPEFAADLRQLKNAATGVIVYTYIDHHLNRVIGASDIANDSWWYGALPAFQRENGRLKTEGSFREIHPLRSFFMTIYTNVLRRSYFLSEIFPALPFIRPQHFDLVADIIEDLGREARLKSGIPRFVVLFYPQSATAARLIPRLHARGIETIDWSTIMLTRYAQPTHIPYDGHPTKEAHAVIGRELARELTRAQEP